LFVECTSLLLLRSNSNRIGFAISSKTFSRIVPPNLGLALEASPVAIAEDYNKSFFINAIQKGGLADIAGVHGASIDQYYQRQSGDIIVAVDGHNVTKASGFIS
jgi:S1-C subfamily serine protease